MYTPPNPPFTVPSSTLTDIINKVRRLTKSPSQNQITDDQVIVYINNAYQFDFPQELRMKDLLTNFTFTTVPNQETYKFPTDQFISCEPPLYINGYQSFFTQSQENFYMLYPRLGISSQQLSGNGTAGPYTFTLPNTPILQNNLVISAQDASGNTYTLIDSPTSTATGNLIYPTDTTSATPTIRGTVNYITGFISINAVGFGPAIPSTSFISAQFVPYNPSRPVAALFYQDTFYLRPVPDNAYQVTIQAYISPTQLLLSATPPSSANAPLVNQWWQFIAVAAAMKIFEDRGDFTQMQNFAPIYEKYKLLVQRRTLVEMANERVATVYSEQVNYPLGNFFNQF